MFGMDKSVRINVSMSADLYAKMERARGDVSRSKFVQRALERELNPPAPSHASVTRKPTLAETWRR